MTSVLQFVDPKAPVKPSVVDCDGRAMALFTCSFDHEGRTYCLELPAYSWGDAELRLLSLVGSIQLDGEIHVSGMVDIDSSVSPDRHLTHDE